MNSWLIDTYRIVLIKSLNSLRGLFSLAYKALTPGRMTRLSLRLMPRLGALAVVAALFCIGSMLSGGGVIAAVLGAIGATMLGLFGVVHAIVWIFRRGSSRAQDAIAEFVKHDASPCFVTDSDGEIWYKNDTAQTRFNTELHTLADVLDDVFANPSAVLFRLQARAAKAGAAREDIVTRGGHVRLGLHQLARGGFLWRLEEIAEKNNPSRGADGSYLPRLTVGRNGAILSMNSAARGFVGERVKSLDRIFPKLPVQSGRMNEISTAAGQVDCMVAELDATASRRELFLLPGVEVSGPQRESWSYFDELPVPLLKVAQSGEVLLSNRLARDLLGRETCDGGQLYDMMEGLGRSISDWLNEAISGQNNHFSEFLRVKRDDREVFLQVLLKKVVDKDETVLIAVLNDATELKTLEAQFVQSQKMQAIGQLAGGVAHDFNNLLTAISGHCDLLLLRHDQGDSDYGDLVQINQNSNRAAALVGQLLAFSRKQTLRPEVLDLRDTLSDLTHLLNRLVGEKVTLSLSHDPVLQQLRADKRQLEQVVMNLVVNARDAMPSGGKIWIETEGFELNEPLKRDRAEVAAGSYVSVKIRDEGEGIPADKLQKVFEPFFTTKRVGEGTGLGLSTAYGIVKQTGGFIFVDSTVGEGTCFTLLFPAFDGQEEVAVVTKSEKPAEAAKHGDGVVLLVEDEAPVRAFASRALRLRGYTVLEAESAEDALKTLEDTELSVDIFVTDVVMPGMDGPSWVRKALEKRPGVRVVFVSGYAEDAFGETQQHIPNSVFLPKPFSLAELTETVQRQLH